eukprot:6929303-Heterocapsa_arctica.AAC.1
MTEEIATLIAGTAALDKDVAEATEMRKQENADYSSLVANDGAAKEVLGWTMNRLLFSAIATKNGLDWKDFAKSMKKADRYHVE